jgi:transcriptional regulator with XRE-family HTH domain
MVTKDHKNLAKLIGTRIRKAREEAGMSQKELANLLSLSDKAVSSYEVGRTTPSVLYLKKIGLAVQKPISYFDDTPESDDIDLQIKLKIIERELLEIKRLLGKRDK